MEAPDPPPSHDSCRPVATTSQDQVSPITTTTTGPAHSPGMPAARSYECTFCKRGFSNAQALGGHMNIHRKDRDRANNKPKHHPLINIIAPDKVPADLQLQYYPSEVTSTYLPSLTPRVGFDNNPSTSSTTIEQGEEELDLELRLGFVGDEVGG